MFNASGLLFALGIRTLFPRPLVSGCILVRLVEQVIVVPKITLHDVIPQRTVLPVPQMAEQLVEPVPSDDFVLVEEEGGGGGGAAPASGPGVSCS